MNSNTTDIIDYPSDERKEIDADFLSRTRIPSLYQTNAHMVEWRGKDVTGTRPSKARELHSYHEGSLSGCVQTVRDLFGYASYEDAVAVLDMAVERLPAVEAGRRASRAVIQAERDAKSLERTAPLVAAVLADHEAEQA
jgi:hypothetical protein